MTATDPQTALPQAPETAIEESLRFHADDGFPLNGTVFKNRDENAAGPLVLISPAAAVPRGFYAGYARHLVDAGCAAVLTYDYRGLPGSPRPPGWRGRLNMIDWGARDFTAAAHALEERGGSGVMVGVGHSYGGQALGVSAISERFARYAAVATLSGYWRNTDEPRSVLLKMNAIGIPLTYVFGMTPSWSGIGEPLPASVFRDWARW